MTDNLFGIWVLEAVLVGAVWGGIIWRLGISPFWAIGAYVAFCGIGAGACEWFARRRRKENGGTHDERL